MHLLIQIGFSSNLDNLLLSNYFHLRQLYLLMMLEPVVVFDSKLVECLIKSS